MRLRRLEFRLMCTDNVCWVTAKLAPGLAGGRIPELEQKLYRGIAIVTMPPPGHDTRLEDQRGGTF
jgi:hypothetical protein